MYGLTLLTYPTSVLKQIITQVIEHIDRDFVSDKSQGRVPYQKKLACNHLLSDPQMQSVGFLIE